MNKKKRSILIIVVLFFTPLFVWAINTVATGYKTTTSNQTINAHGVCRQVQHTASTSYFVPTKTSNEWLQFRNNKPGAVTITNCSTVGVIVDLWQVYSSYPAGWGMFGFCTYSSNYNDTFNNAYNNGVPGWGFCDSTTGITSWWPCNLSDWWVAFAWFWTNWGGPYLAHKYDCQ